MKILVLIEYYKPGYKAGGPLQSLANIINNFPQHEFKILTKDRDLGDQIPYPHLKKNQWLEEDNSKIKYLSPPLVSFQEIYRNLKKTNYDLLYLNSFFSLFFSIWPIFLHKLRLIKPPKIIIAPRGEFSPKVLKLKKTKKLLFIFMVRLLKLYKGVTWHVSSDYEKKDLIKFMGSNNKTIIAPNLPFINKENFFIREKNRGELKIIFLSRILPNKNLDFAIELINNLKDKVIFDIYGPLEDYKYWKTCLKKIKSSPQNIKISYQKPLLHEELVSTFNKYHLFLFPSLGENFGHVIFEALSTGCPVLISDKTFWRNLEDKKIGWDIPLKNKTKFHSILQTLINLDKNEYLKISKNAYQFAKNYSKNNQILEKYNYLFS